MITIKNALGEVVQTINADGSVVLDGVDLRVKGGLYVLNGSDQAALVAALSESSGNLNVGNAAWGLKLHFANKPELAAPGATDNARIVKIEAAMRAIGMVAGS